jgi:YtoQ family protein
MATAIFVNFERMKYNVFLSGEIHSNWREEIIEACEKTELSISFSSPETDHDSSDNSGNNIVGQAPTDFFKDHQSAKVNSIRIKTGIRKADIVVVRFGEKYRQWNAAFDAGFATALGKSVIVIHPEEFTHALKEVDASAQAVVQTNAQVVELLKYLCRA